MVDALVILEYQMQELDSTSEVKQLPSLTNSFCLKIS